MIINAAATGSQSPDGARSCMKATPAGVSPMMTSSEARMISVTQVARQRSVNAAC
jgi:hypothetical protein